MAQHNTVDTTSDPTVTVACKLPHGLRLRVFDMVSNWEPVMGGGTREVKIAQARPEFFDVMGNSHPQNAAPKSPIAGGYALTFGIPKDFWALWLEQNKTSDMVKNNLIFAHTKPEMVNGEAKEKEEVKSGLERLDRNKLPKGLKQYDGKAA